MTVPFQRALLPLAFRATAHNLGPNADRYTIAISNVNPGWQVFTTQMNSACPAAWPGFPACTSSDGKPPGAGVADFVFRYNHQPIELRDHRNPHRQPGDARRRRFRVPSRYAVAHHDPGHDSARRSRGEEPRERGGDHYALRVSDAGRLYRRGPPRHAHTRAGQTMDVPYSVTVASGVSLGSNAILHVMLAETTPGAEVRHAGNITIRVLVPGGEAIAQASGEAFSLGKTELSDRLTELSFALNTLVGTPTDRIANSQSVAALDAVIRVVDADPILAANYSSSPHVRPRSDWPPPRRLRKCRPPSITSLAISLH